MGRAFAREAGGAFPERVTAFRPEMAVARPLRQAMPGLRRAGAAHRLCARTNATTARAARPGGVVLADRALSRLLHKELAAVDRRAGLKRASPARPFRGTRHWLQTSAVILPAGVNMPSFDIVSGSESEVEVRNAVDQTNKEVSTALRLQGIRRARRARREGVSRSADDDFKLKQVTGHPHRASSRSAAWTSARSTVRHDREGLRQQGEAGGDDPRGHRGASARSSSSQQDEGPGVDSGDAVACPERNADDLGAIALVKVDHRFPGPVRQLPRLMNGPHAHCACRRILLRGTSLCCPRPSAWCSPPPRGAQRASVRAHLKRPAYVAQRIAIRN